MGYNLLSAPNRSLKTLQKLRTNRKNVAKHLKWINIIILGYNFSSAPKSHKDSNSILLLVMILVVRVILVILVSDNDVVVKGIDLEVIL